jgi:hypothetical protein
VILAARSAKDTARHSGALPKIGSGKDDAGAYGGDTDSLVCQLASGKISGLAPPVTPSMPLERETDDAHSRNAKSSGG